MVRGRKKGFKVSEETKKKISESNIGNQYAKGKGAIQNGIREPIRNKKWVKINRCSECPFYNKQREI